MINNNAPNNTLIIKNSGNISIGAEVDNFDLYKLNVIGNLNAINLYENGVKVINMTDVNTSINTTLQSYLTIDNASTTYPTKYSVTNDLNNSIIYLEDAITTLLSTNSKVS